jgi:hypothetical protein
MSPSPDPQSRLLSEILARGAGEPEFRARLLNDPAAVLRDEFGMQIPPSYRVQFIEKADGVDALIVLPDPEASDELSDAELEDVAGGGQAPPPPLWSN